MPLSGKPVSKRTLLIMAALSLPAVVFIALKPPTHTDTPIPAVKPGAMSAPPVILPPLDLNASFAPLPPPATYQEARDRVIRRIAVLKQMTPEQWAAQRAINPKRPPTIEQALAGNEKRLHDLENMTPQQWAAEQKNPPPPQQQQPPPQDASWDSLPVKKKLELLDIQQRKLDELKRELRTQAKDSAAK